MKNLLNEGDKQLVASPGGGKAMLIFRGKYKKMFVDSYQPSSRYFEHVKGRITTINLSAIGKPRPRINLNKIGTHFYLIGLYLSAIFNIDQANPNADDSWLDDTPEMQLAKAEQWKRRPIQEKNE